MLAAILDFLARHHLCQFMPAVSETTDNRKHFDIWHILLYLGVRVTPRKSGQFHSLSPYHKEISLYVCCGSIVTNRPKETDNLANMSIATGRSLRPASSCSPFTEGLVLISEKHILSCWGGLLWKGRQCKLLSLLGIYQKMSLLSMGDSFELK